MRTLEDIAAFIEGRPFMMEALRAVESLDLHDSWIGAGFVRNAAWRALHGEPVEPGGEDLDVLHFTPADLDPAADAALEARLRARLPLPWSVRNQARMHSRNGDAPYRDTADAMRRWPETATTVAARLRHGRVEILAPHGVGDLLGLILRATPGKGAAFRARLAEKRWAERWPRLTLISPDAA